MGIAVDEPDSKRRRTSLSPPPQTQPADAPLLPLAASYYDEDEEEEEAAEVRFGSHNGAGNLIDESYGSDYSSGGDLAEAKTPAVRRHPQVELRRDCPYLDTVNRQVVSSKFLVLLFLSFQFGLP